MREKQPFDDWMIYDGDKDKLVLREDAPDEIKKAYNDFNKENEERIASGKRILR